MENVCYNSKCRNGGLGMKLDINTISKEIVEREEKRKILLAERSLIISKFFSSVLGNIELSNNTICGDSKYIDNALHTIIAIRGKYNIDENAFNDWIYCYLIQKDAYYYVASFRSIYVNYEDICYEINIESTIFDHENGVYRVLCDVCYHNKSDFILEDDSLYAYHKGIYQKQKELNSSPKTCLELTIDKNTNIIEEVVKMSKKVDNQMSLKLKK